MIDDSTIHVRNLMLLDFQSRHKINFYHLKYNVNLIKISAKSLKIKNTLKVLSQSEKAGDLGLDFFIRVVLESVSFISLLVNEVKEQVIFIKLRGLRVIDLLKIVTFYNLLINVTRVK